MDYEYWEAPTGAWLWSPVFNKMTQKWSKRSPGNSIKQQFSQKGITGNWNFNEIARLTIYSFRNYRKSYSASWKKANSRRRRPKKTNASFASPVGRRWRPCHVSAPHERRSCPTTSLRFQLTSAGGHQVVCRRCFVKTIQSAVAQRLLPLRCVICRYAGAAPFTTRFETIYISEHVSTVLLQVQALGDFKSRPAATVSAARAGVWVNVTTAGLIKI